MEVEDKTVVTLVKRVEDLSDLVALAKVHFIGQDDNPPSNVKPVETRAVDERIFSKSGALAPPYGPDVLCKIYEHSSSLRQNIDAYAVNIDANGHRFDPVIDLEADDAFDEVRDAMFLEALHEAEKESGGEPVEIEAPTDEEVEERIETMTDEMRLEKAKLESFFRFCCADESFISLRQKTRTDQEVIGGGFWEIIRNGAGEPSQFTYVPAFTMRLMPLKRSDLIETEVNIKTSPLSFDKVKTRKRFRRFVQVFEGTKVHFKSFGDPRFMSAESGQVYKTAEALQSAEAEGRDPEDGPVPLATEVIYFPIHSPRSPYGIPRWIGNLLAVLGTRQAEEVNFLYFENKSVPPLAILVSGGRMSSDSTKRLEDYVENKIKGRKNFHKILVIEAVSAGTGALADNASARMRIEIVPLTGSQQQDALFLKYDERNFDKVGMSFRLPRLLRGDIRDFNRATAEAALEFAEAQVFAPLRQDFDWGINRNILAELEIKFWTFASNSPTTSNPLDLATIIKDLVLASVLTPEEARELAKAVFNRDFKKIDELWTKIPPELLKAGFLPGGEEFPGEEPPAGAPAPEPEIDPETGEPVEAAAGDVGTGDLRTGGGAKVPAQGRPRRRRKPDRKSADGFTRLPAGIGKRYTAKSRARNMRKLAKDLVDLRAALLAEERRTLADEDLALRKADLEDGNIEVLKVPADELARLFEG